MLAIERFKAATDPVTSSLYISAVFTVDGAAATDAVFAKLLVLAARAQAREVEDGFDHPAEPFFERALREAPGANGGMSPIIEHPDVKRMLLTMPRCSIITPLGLPVEPDVYRMKSGSSAPISSGLH